MGIDEEVLDLLPSENVLKALESDIEMKRVVLNCFCELLSLYKKQNQELEALEQTITIASTQKVVDFFSKVKENTVEEEKRVKTYNKAHRGHRKKS